MGMFMPAQFVDTEFHSAKEKAKFANYFTLFVVAGFPRKLFTRWFYQSLCTNTFGMCAELNLEN